MGLFNTIGKMAGSKVLEKVTDEFTKKQNREQNRQQSGGYCNYVKTNLARICKMLAELEGETKTLISNVSSAKGMKLTFKEKGEVRKTKEKAEKNLQYLYLARDVFTALSKTASGLTLNDEDVMLVAKFAPFFDGVPVLDIYEDDDSDDSLLGAFKEVDQEFMEVFISSKKSAKKFDFDEYLYRYDEKIEEFIIPDVDSAIESFKAAMAVEDPATVSPVTAAPAEAEQIACPNCGTMIDAYAKFCLECGNKIELKKPSFCTQCGEPIVEGAKFCAACGAKIC